MFEQFILFFFLARYLKKTIPAHEPQKKWDNELNWAMIITALFVVMNAVFTISPIIKVVEHLAIIAVILIIYILPDFRIARNIILAVLPFVLASFVKDVVHSLHSAFFTSLRIYVEVVYSCTVVWMIAMLIISKKQRTALQKERKIREEEEEQNRVTAARKAELEIMVTERTSALLAQKKELEHALLELRETQAQLIQKEKMASLGELTAGIAHEIQNPLNFVNNFSEVNKELIEELEKEIGKGNMMEVQEIARDIRENEVKIIHHGKRADAIVKGMLQHSRASTGQKELTDINELADEYLRLSYHGLRAKDKSFNATMEVNFDKTLPKINVIPQDVGRVILNIFTNAFYSVTEKKKLLGAVYEPVVTVTTKSVADQVEICIRDNGVGIPQKVLDKIYQPFYSTKPAGQGTGLGLSISYDIITKVHGGHISVETKEGEFAEFIILLPNR